MNYRQNHTKAGHDGPTYTSYQELFESRVERTSISGDELRGLCPFHDDNRPSFSANLRTGLWRCFACGEKGNAKQFAAKVGATLTGDSPYESDEPEQEPEEQSPLDEAEALVAHQALLARPDLLVRLAQDRGWTEQTVRQFQLGLDPKDDRWITLPLRNENGTYLGLYRHWVFDRPTDTNLKKGLVPRGFTARLWPPAPPKSDLVLIVEGAPDALLAISLGFEAYTVVPGAERWQPGWVDPFQTGKPKRIAILPHNDAAGVRKADHAVAAVLGTAEEVVVVTLPGVGPKGDLTDWVRAGGTAAELRTLCEAAESVRHHLNDNDGSSLVFQTASGWQYRVGSRNQTDKGIQVVLVAVTPNGKVAHEDSVPLWSAKKRTEFANRCGDPAVAQDLLELHQAVREYRPPALHAKAATGSGEETEDDEAVAAAEIMLTDPNLITRIAEDLEALGIVGQEAEKKIVYLAATGRKLNRPLAIRITAVTSAGKSYLVDRVVELLPPEDVVRTTGLSPQSLVYLPKDGLKHKVLYVAEEVALREKTDGEAVVMSYVRELLSHGKISRLVPVKGPAGVMETVQVEVEGPVGLFLTGTQIGTDDELATRLWTLGLDESSDQTCRIHTYQKRAATAEGMAMADRAETIRAKHRAAQRLLEPLLVLIPFANHLTFPARRVRARRDLPHLLALIRASALLHQKQRVIQTMEGNRVIVATVQDYRVAHDLFRATAAASSLDEVPEPARRLHAAMWEAVRGKKLPEEGGSTRREIAVAIGWEMGPTYRALRALEETGLVDSEGRKGQTKRYSLAADPGSVPGLDELLAPETLETEDPGWAPPDFETEDTTLGGNPDPFDPESANPDEEESGVPSEGPERDNLPWWHPDHGEYNDW